VTRAARAVVVVVVLLMVVAVGGCAQPPPPAWLITKTAATPLAPSSSRESVAAPWTTSTVDLATAPTFDGRLALVGTRLDPAGTLTVWLLVTGELAGRTKPSLVMGWSAEALRSVPLVAWLHPLEWRPGDVVEVTVPLAAPPTPSSSLSSSVLMIGVEDAGRRWAVQAPAGRASHDGCVEVPVAGLRPRPPAAATMTMTTGSAPDAGPHDPPGTLEVRRRRQPIVVDGALLEPDWQTAPMATLLPWKSGAPVTWATTVKLLWDETYLYVGFDVDDDDPHSPWTRRDDPLYDSEALEIFIDADGDRDVYVELQSSPKDVHFDAAFSGGARQHMDTAWNIDVVTATATRTGGATPGYSQEWQVPIAALKDIPAGEPRAGARWSVNIFRLERRRQGETVTSTEASALSPPERGDFHALDRFGTLRFSD